MQPALGQGVVALLHRGQRRQKSMTLYEAYASDIAQAIASGVLRPGDRLPSVREACRRRGISPATVFKAYYLLEADGLIRAEPRSGYYVNPRPAEHPLSEPEPSRPRGTRHYVDVNDIVAEILTSLKARKDVPLGSPFVDPTLLPLERLRQALVASMRRFDPWSTVNDLPPGNRALKRQILKRYLVHGIRLDDAEIVLTLGAMPALNLCLEAVTRPGDTVVVESPSFYVALQALQRLGLKAIELATDCREGIDLARLAQVLERQRPQACWLMTNFQNPLGSLMPVEKKRELVALLARHEVPLIEDDVYAELYQGRTPPVSAKSFDRHGLVMHCGSFSKTLAPGYRVGWAAAGRFAPQVERLKLMTLLSGAVPTQDAVSTYLQEGGYDAHLRRLRERLAGQQSAMLAAVERHFPDGTRVTRPQGGYFIWLELPPAVDARELFSAAGHEGVSLAPGPMFSGHGGFRNCIRLNTGQQWTPKIENAVARIGRLAARQSGKSR
jgi:DNA-binding transcriptional MocR family regulator